MTVIKDWNCADVFHQNELWFHKIQYIFPLLQHSEVGDEIKLEVKKLSSTY